MNNILSEFKKMSLEGYLCTTKLVTILEDTVKTTKDAKKLLKINLESVEAGQFEEKDMSIEYIKMIAILNSINDNIKVLEKVFSSALSDKMKEKLKEKE